MISWFIVFSSRAGHAGSKFENLFFQGALPALPGKARMPGEAPGIE
jgi:hypothetical protein